jgi:hypothetical protein
MKKIAVTPSTIASARAAQCDVVNGVAEAANAVRWSRRFIASTRQEPAPDVAFA